MPPFLTFYRIPPFDCRTITNLLYVPSSAGNQGDYAFEGCGDDNEVGIEVMMVLLRSNSPGECILPGEYAKISSSESDVSSCSVKWLPRQMVDSLVCWTEVVVSDPRVDSALLMVGLVGLVVASGSVIVGEALGGSVCASVASHVSGPSTWLGGEGWSVASWAKVETAYVRL
jgi:hypothetical protein